MMERENFFLGKALLRVVISIFILFPVFCFIFWMAINGYSRITDEPN